MTIINGREHVLSVKIDHIWVDAILYPNMVKSDLCTISDYFNGVCGFQGIDWSEKAQLFATCSSDKHVRLYDPRGKSGTLVHATLTGHQSWVSSVKWSPGNENELVVVSALRPYLR